jgi:signal transduction histidine kinase
MIRNKHSERELLQEIQRLQAELEVLRASDSIRQEQHLQRLQILHEIDHAILSSQDEAETALIALRQLGTLVPDYNSSSVLVWDQSTNTAEILAIDLNDLDEPIEFQDKFTLDQLSVDLNALENGHPYSLPDTREIESPTPLQSAMLAQGIQSYLTVPLLASKQVIGTLNLASSSAHVFESEHEQIAREVADSLAIALQQARLQKGEKQGRREAEVMRDIMASLASAGNLNQTLEIILINLRNVVSYDRAALYLLDENQQFVPAEENILEIETSFRSHFDDDALIADMRKNKSALSVADIQHDPRFTSWPDMGAIHGWLGAPLIAGDEMVGFISLGSLESNAYSEADVALVQSFTRQVAQVLEKAWLQEQSHRRTEELEVLSSLTFALGKEDSREGTLSAVIEQITQIFGAQCGTFIFPNEKETQLIVKFSQDENLVGGSHFAGEDALWQVFHTGDHIIIRDIPKFLLSNQAEIYVHLFGDMQSAAILPLSADGTNFGVLCIAFKNRRFLSSEEINLLVTISDIAGASLRRAVVLEALERQVYRRTQRLSTLYNINAVSNEPLDLEAVLEQLLSIALDTNNSQMGTIHLIDARENELKLFSQLGIPPDLLPRLVSLDLERELWASLVFSSQPLVVPDITSDERLKEILPQDDLENKITFISTPIRAKGIPMGLLSIYRDSIQDYSVEDITLLMTIAGQIGGSVERARLITQAEQAAVFEERQRLARELHDSVTQLLYSQVLFATAGRKSIDQGQVDPAEQYLNRIDHTAQQALKEMRLLVYELNPQDLLIDGFISALNHRLEAVEKRAGMDVSLSVEGELKLDDYLELELYRLVQEALNNTLKHAKASSVNIRIQSQPQNLLIEIEDDGIGFDLQKESLSGGMGLSTMEERAAALGGELIIRTEPDHGTRIRTIIEDLQ